MRLTRRRTTRGAGAALVAVLLLSGCTTPEPANEPTGAGTVVPDARLTVGAVLEPTSLDVLTVAGAALDQALLDNVYETLLDRNDEGEIGAGLAELPEVSADGLRYTFTLRDGVTFSDGRPMTAADAAWSLQQVTDPKSRSPKAAAFTSVASVEAAGERRVVVTLEQRDTDLTFNLTQRGGAVLPRGATGLADRAVGTGPFVLPAGGWARGSSLSLVRNERYWGTRPTLAAVTFRYFTDPNAAANALVTGDVQVLTGVDSDQFQPLKDDDRLTVTNGKTDGEVTLGMQNTRGPLRDRRVRQAIRHAIDHEGLLELFGGYGTLIGGPVSPNDPWYEDLTGTAPYDVARAKALLAEAGVSNPTLQLVVPNITYATRSATAIQSDLKAVGITVEIDPVEFATWLDRVFTKADYDLTIVAHVEPRDIGNYADPGYYWRYDSDAVQQLVTRARQAPDQATATRLYAQAARRIAQDSPVDWLYLLPDLTGALKTVSGYPTDNTASRFDASRITVRQG
jgi:peptide/nickel transport system substrate-binding protein